MPLPTPVDPSFSRCSSVSNMVRSFWPVSLRSFGGELLDGLLLAVDLQRRNDRIGRDEIGERHGKPVRGSEISRGAGAADHRGPSVLPSMGGTGHRRRVDPADMTVWPTIHDIDAAVTRVRKQPPRVLRSYRAP